MRGLTLMQVDKAVLAELPEEVAAELRAGLPASSEPFAKAGNLRPAEPSSSGSSSEEDDAGAVQCEEDDQSALSSPLHMQRRPQSACTPPSSVKRRVSDRKQPCTAAALLGSLHRGRSALTAKKDMCQHQRDDLV